MTLQDFEIGIALASDEECIAMLKDEEYTSLSEEESRYLRARLLLKLADNRYFRAYETTNRILVEKLALLHVTNKL